MFGFVGYFVGSGAPFISELMYTSSILYVLRMYWIGYSGILYLNSLWTILSMSEGQFLKLKNTDRNYNLRNIETHLAFPKCNFN